MFDNARSTYKSIVYCLCDYGGCFRCNCNLGELVMNIDGPAMILSIAIVGIIHIPMLGDWLADYEEQKRKKK